MTRLAPFQSFTRPVVLIGLLVVLWASPVWAKTFALVIGIDRYTHITPLRGAVNDAVDISSAIAALEPEALTILTNERATRDNIMSTWRDYLDRAAPGDTIIVTFAGHGASEPAAFPETEEDGRDETFLLAGFAPAGPAAAERIRDDEIAELIASRPDVEHVLVADSCHSGTAIRSTTFDVSYRFFTHDAIRSDPLPPPPPPADRARNEDELSLSNSVFFAAVGDEELAPEINIEGNVRGALSYAFAQGLRGQADRDDDGLITKGELEIHIRRQVKTLLEGKQKPRVSPVGYIEKPLFDLRANLHTAEPAFARLFADLPTVPVFIPPSANPPFDISVLSGVHAVSAPMAGGVVIDFTAEELRSGTGDLLRKLTREVGYNWLAQAQAVVDKSRAVNAIAESSVDSKINVSFSFGDELYYEYDVFGVLITGRSTSHVTVVNLSAAGRMQWVYPRYAPIDQVTGLNDPRTLPAKEPLQFDAEVWAPFGAEHILVIETADAHDAVRRAAHRFDDTQNIELFWRELHIALKDVPHSVGVHSYFTIEEKDG